MMSPSDGLKRLLYDRVLHFTHLTEQFFSTEMEAFAELTRQHGLTSIPNNMTSVHVLDCIGSHEPINSTSIAEKMSLSKASITKISTKLLQEGYIKRSQLNDNRKEIFFSLSPKGRELYEVHARMHEIIEQRFIREMEAFSESELQASLKFLQTMINHRGNMIKGDVTELSDS
jgi:DNA-binding MarR family transcriptional regulator